MNEPRRGLDPLLVAAWRRRTGLGGTGADGVPGRRLRGRTGVAAHPMMRVHTEHPDGFEALIFGRQLSMSQLHVGLYTPCVMRWEPRELDQAEPRLFVIMHTVPGAVSVRHPGRECVELPGQIIAVRSDRAFHIERQNPGDLIVVSIPAGRVGAQMLRSQRATTVAGSESLLVRSTSQFLRRFVWEAAVSAAPIEPEVERAGIELIHASLGQEVDSCRARENSAFVRMAVRNIIDRRYSDQTLSADAIARDLHMSRRHLYRHFSGSEESVSALIAARRLAAAREALAEPISLEEVAANSGFGSVTTMRNRFRSEYGVTPSEFRDRMRRERRSKLGHGHRVSALRVPAQPVLDPAEDADIAR